MRTMRIMVAAGATLLGLLAASHVPARAAESTKPMVLPFIENDYAAALARARETKLPLFIEVWAPW